MSERSRVNDTWKESAYGICNGYVSECHGDNARTVVESLLGNHWAKFSNKDELVEWVVIRKSLYNEREVDIQLYIRDKKAELFMANITSVSDHVDESVAFCRPNEEYVGFMTDTTGTSSRLCAVHIWTVTGGESTVMDDTETGGPMSVSRELGYHPFKSHVIAIETYIVEGRCSKENFLHKPTIRPDATVRYHYLQAVDLTILYQWWETKDRIYINPPHNMITELVRMLPFEDPWKK